MKTLISALTLVSLCFWLASCSKDNYPKMRFDQTQCMDSTWRTVEKGGKKSFKKYFEDEYDIHFLSVRLKDEPGLYCRSCSCPSGSVIVVRASAMDTSILVKEGFEFE